MDGIPHSKQMAFGSGLPRGNMLDGIRLNEAEVLQTEEAKLCIAHFKLKVETSKANTLVLSRRVRAAEPQPKHQTSFELVKSLSIKLRIRDLETLCPLRRGIFRDNEGANAE
ncbi:MAG: hypothetical protein ACTS4Z_01095 [Candidatus Hodgkinia cicadicola]